MKERDWCSGSVASRRKSEATGLFKCINALSYACSQPSFTLRGHSGCTPRRFSRCQQLIEQFQSRLMSTSGSIKESPTTALYSSRFHPSFTCSLLHLNSTHKSHHACDRHAFISSEALLWHTYPCCWTASANRDSDRFCFIIQTELHFVLIFFSRRQWGSARHSCHRSANHQDSYYTCFPFLKEACFLLSAAMFLSFFYWSLFTHISLLDAEYLAFFLPVSKRLSSLMTSCQHLQ